MAKKKNNDVSQEIQDEAIAIARKTQKPGQTKEQTRLIALGIQKGIAEYKKSAKNKQRQADKAKKKLRNNEQQKTQENDTSKSEKISEKNTTIPWSLLVISWLGFAAYLFSRMY